MDNDPPAESTESSPLKRLLQFLKILKAPDTAEDLEQEIQEILEEGEEQGLISRQEGEMISSIFEFRETIAREIMTPRTEMVSAPDTASRAELIALITDKGYTRIPIYSSSPDKIIGILHAKDLLTACAAAEPEPTAKQFIKPATIVPEDKKLVALLTEFQSQKIHMAIVTDEFGGVRGLITLEDILEEIVGEIRDEHDKIERERKVIDANTLLADAKINIEEIENFFGIELPEGPYDSVGGLLTHQLGRVPEAGTSTVLKGLSFQVLAASQRRIKTVKIQKSPAAR